MDELTSVMEYESLPALISLLKGKNIEYLSEACKFAIYKQWDEGFYYIIKHPYFNPMYDRKICFSNCISNSMYGDNIKYLKKILSHPKVYIEIWKESILKEAVYYGYEKCTKFILLLFPRDYKFDSEVLTLACGDSLNEEVVRILINDRRFPITKEAIQAATESNNQTIINLLR